MSTTRQAQLDVVTEFRAQAVARGIGGGFSEEEITRGLKRFFDLEDPEELDASEFCLKTMCMFHRVNVELMARDRLKLVFTLLRNDGTMRGIVLPHRS